MPAIADPAVTAIRNRTKSGQAPTYAWLKSQFGRVQISEAVYHSLNRGRAILETVDQLDQYLFSYSPMVASQWAYVSSKMHPQSTGSDERLIDYGCGQGLAGLLLHDRIGPALLGNVVNVMLIEPSGVALQRATAVYQALAPHADVTPVHADFNSLQAQSLAVGRGDTTHLFSNVLDIDGYDHVDLLRKGLAPGTHTIMAVGHDRTAHGYSQGFDRLRAAVEGGTLHPNVRAYTGGVEAFRCGNRAEPAVMWLCKFEVSDG